MKDFEVTLVQAEAIRKSIVEHGGNLSMAQSDLSIYEINKQLVVINPVEAKGRQRIKRVTIITSEVIADKEWFKSFIEHEAQRKRMHGVENKRKPTLSNAPYRGGIEILLHSADWEL